jgi:hypothetical protein
VASRRLASCCAYIGRRDPARTAVMIASSCRPERLVPAIGLSAVPERARGTLQHRWSCLSSTPSSGLGGAPSQSWSSSWLSATRQPHGRSQHIRKRIVRVYIRDIEHVAYLWRVGKYREQTVAEAMEFERRQSILAGQIRGVWIFALPGRP